MKGVSLFIAGLLFTLFDASTVRADSLTLKITGATTYGMGIDAIGEIAGLEFDDKTPGAGLILNQCASSTVSTVSICRAQVDLLGKKILKVYRAQQVMLVPAK